MRNSRLLTSHFLPAVGLAFVLALAQPARVEGQPAAGASSLPARGAGESVDNTLPQALRDVDLEQLLGAQVPLDLVFRDELGSEIELGSYFGAERPVILSLVYYDCPMLCTLVLGGLTSAAKAIPFDIGREFDIVTVSFDPRETPAQARAKKAEYLGRYGRAGAAEGWHFLTGDGAAIDRLTAAVGFHATYDSADGEYAHAAGIFVLTPEGKIARVFYGIEYAIRDLRLALVEASRGEIGTFTDKLLLFCFHYDPSAGRYSAAVINLVRAGGVMTVLGTGLVIGVFLRRERSNRVPRGPRADHS